MANKNNPFLPPALTSKPFCDCEICACKDCPDILQEVCPKLKQELTDYKCISPPVKTKKSLQKPLHIKDSCPDEHRCRHGTNTASSTSSSKTTSKTGSKTKPTKSKTKIRPKPKKDN